MATPTKSQVGAPPDYNDGLDSPTKKSSPRKGATLRFLQSESGSPYTPPSPVEPSYQRNRASKTGLGDIPDLPPSDRPPSSYKQRRPGSPESQSPTRPWTPTRGSVDLKRPPPSTPSYEPAELNGSPRPATFIRPADIYRRVEEEREKQRLSMDSTRKSNDTLASPPKDEDQADLEEQPIVMDEPETASSPFKGLSGTPNRIKSLFRRTPKKDTSVDLEGISVHDMAHEDDGPIRPLPPAPLFASGRPMSSRSTLVQKEDDDEFKKSDEDDVFAPHNDEKRPQLITKESFASDSTFTEDLYPKPSFEQYGPAPEGRQHRRGARLAQMAKKEVRLINGELILECKIPTILYSFLPHKNSIEFTHMRYTAVTCDPDEFVSRGYKLRQNIGKVRETELLICVTMYNEDETHFTRTMHAIMKNISHFCSRSKSRTWGEDGWEKIVVCIISDGRQKVHPRTLDALAAMGVYQEGIAKNSVNSREVSAHVYEYTTQVSLDPDLKFKGREKGIMPCQLIFCLKEKNQKKLNSHRWLFNAFAKALNPNVCILLDVGTKPGHDSLYHLWKAFDQDSNVAGAAGEIRAAKGKAWLGLLNPLVASQNFEYKMSNILDKPIESVFGYITVLPGALSAYRYYALQNDSTGHGPLSQYFKGERLHGSGADVFTANMYLAEDRILCWELVAKRNERWVLKYVNNAIGETDVPNSVPEFVSQRRRWLNGAFFAAVYSLSHFRQIWTTDHTMARKILLHIEFLYQFLSLMFTFFSLANFYLTFYFVAGSLSDPSVDPFGHNVGAVIFVILRYSCILLICMQFIISMGNRPHGAKRMYVFSMSFYSVIMVYTVFAALYIVIRQLAPGGAAGGATVDTLGRRDVHNGNHGNNPSHGSASSNSDPSGQDHHHKNVIGNNIFTNLIVSTFSTIGLYFIMSFLYFDPWHMFTSSIQYFALLPSYICTLQVYAFCNAHDVTWGTKGDNIIRNDLGAAVGGKGNTVEVEMPSEQLDIDSCYDEALRNLRDKIEVVPPAVSEQQLHEDYYRAVRTYVVVVWLSANSILAMAVSEAYSGTDVSANFYLKFILWSVAVLALFRAIGSTAFRILSLIQFIAEGRLKWDMKMTTNSWGALGKSSASSSGGGGGLNLGSSTAASWLSEKMTRIGTSTAGSSIGKG